MTSYATAEGMFRTMLSDCLMNGRKRMARENGTLDRRWWHGVLTDPRNRVVTNVTRRMRTGYPAASVAWNLGMRHDVASISWWNPEGTRISDDGITFGGANYGARMMAQLNDVLQLLKEDGASRRTWVPVWGTRDDDFDLKYRRKGKDVPCTLGMSFELDHYGVLHAEVIMRSQSVYGVFPYDVYLMSVLHELSANEIGAKLGQLAWHCISLHVYERELGKARLALASPFDVPDPDPPIEITLTEAMQVYPMVFRELTPVIANSDTIGFDPSDPVIARMLQGYKEINDLARAAEV